MKGRGRKIEGGWARLSVACVILFCFPKT